jgi:hypothetical protein
MRLGQILGQRQRLVECLDRFLGPPKLIQDDAFVEVEVGRFGIQGDCPD